jgi:hypothetical protein
MWEFKRALVGVALMGIISMQTIGAQMACDDSSGSILPCTGIRLRHPTSGLYLAHDDTINQMVLRTIPVTFDLINTTDVYNYQIRRYALRDRGTSMTLRHQYNMLRENNLASNNNDFVWCDHCHIWR